MVDKITTPQHCLFLLIPFSFLGAKPPDVRLYSRIESLLCEKAKRFVV